VRKLKQDATELAGGNQRCQRLRLHFPDQLLRLARDVTQIDAALLRHRGRQQLLDRSREPLDDHGVMGKQAEGFDVENETGRGSLHPEMRVAFRRQGVIGGVHFDDGELAGVVSKPIRGSPRVAGIEGAGIDQRPVGPAAGAIVDVADRLARLEGRSRVSLRKVHPAPVSRAAGRAGADR
jgi:hypothetical protein